MISEKEIGKKMKQIREASGLNQVQIAKFLDVDQSYISKFENGERQFSLELLERLCNLFACTIKEIINDNSSTSCFQFAFRSDTIETDDLNSISEINKIALNLQEMRNLTENNDYER